MFGSLYFSKILKMEILEVGIELFCCFYVKLRVDMLFSNRGDEVIMCHFKETDFGLRNMFPPSGVIPHLLFGRTSCSVCPKWF